MADQSGSLLIDVSEVRTGAAGGLLFVLAAGLHVVGPGPGEAVAVYAVVVALAAGLVGPRSAVLLGLTAWGLLTGFVTHSGGQLGFGPHDLAHLALLTGTAVGVSTLVRLPVLRAAPAQRGTRTSTRPWTQVSSSS